MTKRSSTPPTARVPATMRDDSLPPTLREEDRPAKRVIRKKAADQHGVEPAASAEGRKKVTKKRADGGAAPAGTTSPREIAATKTDTNITEAEILRLIAQDPPRDAADAGPPPRIPPPPPKARR